jgi:hypothetical protein
MSKQLLSEGGLAGQMAHPYENASMQVSKLKEMFKSASEGFPGLKVTEKLDGQNIFLSYDAASREVRAARNKSQAAAGGFNKQSLINALTVDRPIDKRVPQNVVDSYHDALDNFEKVAGMVDDRTFRTEDGGIIFYNAEIMDPRSPNVVDYDAQSLVIHRVGHVKSKDGIMSDIDPKISEEYVRSLEQILKDVQADSGMPVVKVNAITNFKEFLEKRDAFKRAIASIDNAITAVGLTDKDTIGEFLHQRVMMQLRRKLGGFGYSEEALYSMAQAVVFYRTEMKIPRIKTEIAAALSHIPESQQRERDLCRKILRDREALKELSSKAAAPLIGIVHAFAVEILENFTSAYIIQSDVAVNKLRKKVSKKIKDIKGSASKEDLKVLQSGLQKLLGGDADAEEVMEDAAIAAAIEKITTTVEGLVFDFDGRTYKLTGNFAPINQIMGLGRYRRTTSKIEEEDVIEEEMEDDHSRVIAVFPGKFKPPHRGHVYLAKQLLERGVEKLVILVSPLSVGDITAEDSINLWNTYLSREGISSDDVIVIRSPAESPVKAAYMIMDEPIPGLSNIGIPSEGDLIVPAASTKPFKKGVSDIERFSRFGTYQPKIQGVKPARVEDWAIDPESDVDGTYNASDFREALDNHMDISRFIPQSMNQEEVRRILGKFAVEENQQGILAESLMLLIEEVMAEGDWQPIAKKRMKKSMKNMLTKGRKDLTRHGAPFNIDPKIGNSNMFLAKESRNTRVMTLLEENILKNSLAWIKKKGSAAAAATKTFFLNLKNQLSKTKDGSMVLAKVARGRKLEGDEVILLKTSMSDLGKGLPILALFILPGGGVAVVGLSQLAKKFDIELMPSEFINKPEIEEISAMAAGSVSGYSAPLGIRQRKRDEEDT